MERCRVFSSATCGGDLHQLETLVNQWMAQEKPHIVQFAQSSLGDALVLSFLYDDNLYDESAHTAASAHIPVAFERSFDGDDLNPSEDDVPPLPDAELPY